MNGPNTRQSLLVRLCDSAQHDAWEEFVAIYQPLIYRLARQKGFQHADACDLCQEVLTVVGTSIERFHPDPEKGSFRGWLFRIARNLMINVLTRRQSIRGSGDTAIQQLLEQQADMETPASREATRFDLEYRREVFRWAAQRVRSRVAAVTWRAFWLTAVEGESIPDVSRVLGRSEGAIRVARCRVFARIKTEVRFFERKRSLE